MKDDKSPEIQTVESDTLFLINGTVCNELPQLWCSQFKNTQRSRLRHLFIKGSFFVIGFGILIASAVISIQYQPSEIYTNSSYCGNSASAEITNVSTQLHITPSHAVYPYSSLQRLTISQSDIVHNTALLAPTSIMYAPTPVLYSPIPAV